MAKKLSKKAKLTLAQRHLGKAQAAWDPVDWDDLFMYGFYCLEAAVEAAALHVGIPTTNQHWQKAEVAERLHHENGLPDVSELLIDLNTGRKAAAYGDIEAPDLDPQDLISELEAYVEAVAVLLSEGDVGG